MRNILLAATLILALAASTSAQSIQSPMDATAARKTLSNVDAATGRAALGVAASSATVLTSGANVMTGNLKFSGNYGIMQSTSDGADNGYVGICGGGSDGPSRGGTIYTIGNEYSSQEGWIIYRAGNAAVGGHHVWFTGNSIERMRLTYGGNLGIGVTDPYYALEASGSIGLRNPDNGKMKGLTGSRFGYSGSYKALVVGNTSGNETICMGYDPISNPSDSFTGNGLEIFFRNGVVFATPNSANTAFFKTVRISDDHVMIGTTTDDGTNKLQVNGIAFFSGGAVLPNDIGYRCKNKSGTPRAIAYIDPSDVTRLGTTSHATRIDSNGTLTHNGSTIWTAANDGAGSGLDADTVPNATPASASATGTAGMIRYDANYIYICVAANTWKRAAISTW